MKYEYSKNVCKTEENDCMLHESRFHFCKVKGSFGTSLGENYETVSWAAICALCIQQPSAWDGSCLDCRFNFLLMCFLEGKKESLQYMGPCYPCDRSGYSGCPPALAWLSPGCCSGWKISVFLSFLTLVFQINKLKKKGNKLYRIFLNDRKARLSLHAIVHELFEISSHLFNMPYKKTKTQWSWKYWCFVYAGNVYTPTASRQNDWDDWYWKHSVSKDVDGLYRMPSQI